MKECSIVKDLLPLYAEDLVSAETKEFVDGHLNECQPCREELEKISAELPKGNVEAMPIENVKKEIKKRKIKFVSLAILAVVTVAVIIMGYLMSPRYLPYDECFINAEKNSTGELVIEFSDNVTGFSADSSVGEEGKEQYFVSAYNNLLHKKRSGAGKNVFSMSINDGAVVYYTQNNGTDDVLIYGENPDGGVVTLPRLVLGYYLIFAVVIAAILLTLILIFRKKSGARKILLNIFFIPLSYIIAHFCVMAFNTVSYSMPFDFFRILIAAMPIYFILVIAASLIRSKLSRAE